MNGRLVVGILSVLILAGAFVTQWVESSKNRTPALFQKHAAYESAAEAAASSDRLLVVDLMAEWCPPCKEMDRTTWVDQRVVNWIDEHAEAVQVDVDEQGDLARRFGASAIPTLVVLDPETDNELARHVGYLPADAMLVWLEDAVSGW